MLSGYSMQSWSSWTSHGYDIRDKRLRSGASVAILLLVVTGSYVRHLRMRRYLQRQQETYFNIIRAIAAVAIIHMLTYAAYLNQPRQEAITLDIPQAWRGTKSLLQDFSSTFCQCLGILGTLQWGPLRMPFTVAIALVFCLRPVVSGIIQVLGAFAGLFTGRICRDTPSINLPHVGALPQVSQPAQGCLCPSRKGSAQTIRPQPVFLSDLAVDHDGRLLFANCKTSGS